MQDALMRRRRFFLLIVVGVAAIVIAKLFITSAPKGIVAV
jgi:hypothetical protein